MKQNLSIEEKLEKFKAKIELGKKLAEEQEHSEAFAEEMKNLEEAAGELGEKLGKLMKSSKWKKEAKKKRGAGYTRPVVRSKRRKKWPGK